METVEETVHRRRSTTIIYQFRILMSERLIQKASTLRKPKRSTLLSLPGGRPPSPVFLSLASDTLCYSRMISDWPPPRLLFCPFAYCHFICTSSSSLFLLLYYCPIHSPCLLYFFIQCKYFYCYSSTVFFLEIFHSILVYVLSFLILIISFLLLFLLFLYL